MIVYTDRKNHANLPFLQDTLYYRGNVFFDASACECCAKVLIQLGNAVTIETKFDDLAFYHSGKYNAANFPITEEYAFNNDGQLICLDCEGK